MSSSSQSTTSLEGVLFGAGNPLLDISADGITDELLKKYDLKMNNSILAEPKHMPLYAELVENHKVQYVAGGATQNSIRVAQWMLQAPGATTYVGCVGKDAFGEQLRKSATADGVKVCYLEDEKHPTGTCAVLVQDKERSLVANLAAANHYKLEHIQSQEITAIIEKAKVFYSAGFFLTVSVPSILHVAKHANENKKTFCMNISAPFIAQFFMDPLMEAMPYVDYLFGNESEAKAFAEKKDWNETKMEDIALKIAAFPKANADRPRIVVITQGPDAVVVAQAGKVDLFPVPAVAKENIVDVNGAGDAFVGGFLSQLVQGKDLATCVKAGNYGASVILGVSGTVLSGKPAFTA